MFQNIKCTKCGRKLNLPAVHLLCKHSWHQQVPFYTFPGTSRYHFILFLAPAGTILYYSWHQQVPFYTIPGTSRYHFILFLAPAVSFYTFPGTSSIILYYSWHQKVSYFYTIPGTSSIIFYYSWHQKGLHFIIVNFIIVKNTCAGKQMRRHGYISLL